LQAENRKKKRKILQGKQHFPAGSAGGGTTDQFLFQLFRTVLISGSRVSSDRLRLSAGFNDSRRWLLRHRRMMQRRLTGAVDGVDCGFGGKQLFDDVVISVPDGEDQRGPSGIAGPVYFFQNN